MSLRNSGHLPIRWIAKRWAAEANRPEDAAEIENDLIDAVLLGEFQFPVAVEVIRLEDGSIPSNYDARLRSLVETFSRDSRPRSAHEFRNYRQAGGAQKVGPGSAGLPNATRGSGARHGYRT
jgi:hypothetical protein